MPYIIWMNRYETGMPDVDNQHKKLVSLINELFDSISLKERKDVLNGIFTELVNYTIYHFKFEEDLMVKNAYAGFREHKKEHLRFVDQVNGFAAKIDINDNKALLNVINFLRDWLLNHIFVVDKETMEKIKAA